MPVVPFNLSVQGRNKPVILTNIDDIRELMMTENVTLFVNVKGVSGLKGNIANTYRDAVGIARRLIAENGYPANEVFVSAVINDVIADDDIDF